ISKLQNNSKKEVQNLELSIKVHIFEPSKAIKHLIKKQKKMKTYNGQTIKEIKKEYPNIQLTYCRYRGFGDYGLVANYEGHELFVRDSEAMMDRHVKVEKNNYTGTVADLDYSCEVFVDGSSLGTTSKHRAKKYLSLIKTGVEVDSNYLTSTRT